MPDSTIQETLRHNLCCGCGICKGVCPKNCINWIRENGLFIPRINEEQCVNCGACASVCPGLRHNYETQRSAVETITGSFLDCYTAWSRDAQLRYVSASGGVISTMIRELLSSGKYDGAFCLDTYDYRQQLKTQLYTVEKIAESWNQSSVPKSRYLPVSHENAVAYMKKNRNARLILVGTSCAIRGLVAVIKKLHLNRENYLFIGLFCDKVFNYNVCTYWQNQYCNGSALAGLHFKNKESGGWPGDMKFYPEGMEPFYVPLSERAKAKDYFLPERCLYCVDKLNVCADISLGDNYTGKDASELGSNSVIIRTPLGVKIWDAVKAQIETRPAGIGDIQRAQYLDGRLNNLYFGDVKSAMSKCADLNPGIPREQSYPEFMRAWENACRKAYAGAVYDVNPVAIQRQMLKDSRKANPIVSFVRRVVGYIKRRIL